MINDGLFFIIKTNYKCNLGCRYCYEGRESEKIMDSDHVEEMIKRISQYSIAENTPISFVWHGGEPLIHGVSYFEKILNIQKSIGDAFVCYNYLQTNGTLLDEKFADLFVGGGFKVGVSLDGPPLIHDAQRRDYNNNGSFDKVWRGIRHLNDRGVHPGIMSVFTKNTLDHIDDFYDFFSSRSISFRLNPLFIAGNMLDIASRTLFISPEQYGEALVYLFNKWLNEKKCNFTIQPFEFIIRGMLTGNPRSCTFRGLCHKYLKIDPDGNVFPCEIGDNLYCIGNIYSDSLKDLIKSDKIANFRKAREMVKARCGHCAFFGICNGGCSISGRSIRGDISEKDRYCVSYYALFERIKEMLVSLAS